MGLFLSASQRPRPKGCHAVVFTLLLLGPLLAACGQPSVNAGRASATAMNFPPRVVATPAISATATRSTVASSTRTPPPSGTPTRVPGETPTAAPSGTIPGLAEALEDVTAIHVEDDWSGLSTIAPIKAHFDLLPEGSGYTGTAQFSAGGYFPQQAQTHTATRTVALPPDAVRSFLALLATAQGRPGPYTARIKHTDDYPSLRIAVTTNRGEVVFVSRSQGMGYAPWGLALFGATDGYVIDNDMPYRALIVLMPYLDYETLDLLKDAAATSTSTSTPDNLGLCGARSSPTPRMPTLLAIPPRDPVSDYSLDRAYSLTITGWGAAPLPRDRKLVRDPAELAALLALLHTPLPQTEQPVRYNDDLRNPVYLLWRTGDGRRVSFRYDPQLGVFSVTSGGQTAHYAVPPAFAAALRARLCPPALP